MANSTDPKFPGAATQEITRFRHHHNRVEKQTDSLAVEEPLQILLDYPTAGARERMTLAITMRTPGNDEELAAGFLFSEGLLLHRSQILSIERDNEAPRPDNTVVISLTKAPDTNPDQLLRHFFTNSSCGVCGKTSLQALEMRHRPSLDPAAPHISLTQLQLLPEQLRAQLPQFAATGSMHSAALFSADGQLLALREDVGRHNAMDKLLGTLLLQEALPARDKLVLVSGRASFELVQKALMADIGLLAAIGAPTSLAVQLAQRHGMTLVGFLRADSVNIYSAPERVT